MEIKNLEENVCYQLQLLFARLQYSSFSFIDPIKFTNSIKLKPNIQQDPQE